MLEVMLVRQGAVTVMIVARIDGVQLSHDEAVRAARALDLPVPSTPRPASVPAPSEVYDGTSPRL